MTFRFSLLLLLLPFLLFLTGDARPCKTLIISTYSFSLIPQNLNPNPNPDFIAVITEIRPQFPYRRIIARPAFAEPDTKFGAIQEEFNSFRDRTKDILSVVASLLFGAACGALTAGTMYLIWSLFNHGNESYRSLDGFSSGDDDEEDIFNPKKKGYVSIPAAPITEPTKESV